MVGDTNGSRDVFVHDRVQGTTERVSVGSHGEQLSGDHSYSCISPNGRFVAFTDDRGLFVHDRVKGTTKLANPGLGGTPPDGGSRVGHTSFSTDGRYLVFELAATNLVPGDTNGTTDIFLRDRVKGTTERVSVGPGGVEGDDESDNESISANGGFVVFQSAADNLVPGDTYGAGDIFLRDLRTGKNTRISLAPDGTEGDTAASRR